MKKEIEVKARLKDDAVVLEKIKELGGVMSEPIHQTDTVYTKIVGDVDTYLQNDHFVRIRKKGDGSFIFTVKKPLLKKVLTKAEHETKVADGVELEQALFLMGYQISNRVIKTRRTAQIDGFEICIDAVEGLGAFIEIEKVSEEDEVEIRKELDAFLSSLGIAPEDEVFEGYDILTLRKQFA